MKAEILQELFNALDPEEEVAADIIREKDVMREAESQGITCTRSDAQRIIRAIDSRPDDSDSVVEYYLELFTGGELEDE